MTDEELAAWMEDRIFRGYNSISKKKLDEINAFLLMKRKEASARRESAARTTSILRGEVLVAVYVVVNRRRRVW